MKHLTLPLIAMAWLLSSCSQSSKPEDTVEETSYIRYSAHSPEGMAHLESMKIGLEKMSTLGNTDPQSFFYWGAMHHLAPEGCNPNRINPGLESQLGWNTCPHMQPGDHQFHFLTWHRLFLEHFEALIREHSGDPTFALPYWDYSNHETLPQSLQMGPNYESATVMQVGPRSPTLNIGQPINTTSSTTIAYYNCENQQVERCTDVTPTMAFVLNENRYFQIPEITQFSSFLESGMHNCMHNYLGGNTDPADTAVFSAAMAGNQLPPPFTGVPAEKFKNYIYGGFMGSDEDKAPCDPYQLFGLMTNVPSAAFDPVFWLHHSNIDRMWAMWEAQHQQSIDSLTFVTESGQWPYIFFNQEGNLNQSLYDSATQKTNLPQAYTQSYHVSYQYNVNGNLVSIGNFNAPAMALKAEAPPAVFLSASPNETITDGVGKLVSLEAAQNALSSAVKGNLSASAGPYVAEITLQVPKGMDDFVGLALTDQDCLGDQVCEFFSPDNPMAHIVGFFGVGMSHGQHGHGMATDMQEVTFQVGATELMQRLKSDQAGTLRLAVIPFVNGKAEPITVKSISLIDP